MKRLFLLFSCAVAGSVLSSPAQADPRQGGGRAVVVQQAGARTSAPVAHLATFQAPVIHAPAASHIPNVGSRPAMANVFAQHPVSMPTGATAASRGQRSPTIAFGGHAFDANSNPTLTQQAANPNAAATNQNARLAALYQQRQSTIAAQNRFAAQRSAYGSNYAARAVDSHSDWDRSREYFWHHHHYRWYNNAWVIVDPGFYPYDYNSSYDDYPDATVYESTLAAPVPVAAEVQGALARDGYYSGPIDGVAGPATQEAISAFQQDNGLPVTGVIDGTLLDVLGLD